MTSNKKNTCFFLLSVFCLLLSGCGYRLVGTGSTLPDHIKSIHIPVFENTSAQPEIHRELTSEVLQSFISDGRLKVVKKAEADLVMEGTLSYYNIRNVSFNPQDLVSDIIVEIEVQVKVIDQVKDKIFLEQKAKGQWDYQSSTDLAVAERNRLEALDLAYNDMGNRLVSLVIDQF